MSQNDSFLIYLQNDRVSKKSLGTYFGFFSTLYMCESSFSTFNNKHIVNHSPMNRRSMFSSPVTSIAQISFVN